MKAYSYIRMSNPEQIRGDSLRRQLQASQNYADEHGLDLDDSLRDIGKSAFSGEHLDAALGSFLSMVKSGEIASGSWLLVESLDRLSRQNVLDALEQFISIINADITIVTLIDAEVYNRTIIGNDWSKLIISPTIMARAHDESLTKSKRGKAVCQKKRDNALAKPITKMCPMWLRVVDNKFVVLDDRAAIVRRIFDAAMNGEGDRAIAIRLNKDGIPSFRGCNGWYPSSVHSIVKNEAVIGVYQPHQRKKNKRYTVGDPIPDYYPKVISEDLYWRVQSARKLRFSGAGGRKDTGYPNLLRGIVHCHRCGASLIFVNKDNKGPHAGRAPYVVCGNASRGICFNNAHYPYKVLEGQVLSYVPMVNIRSVVAVPRQNESPVAGLEAELEAKNARLEQLYEMGDLRGAKPHIERLSAEIDDIETRLVEARKNARMAEADATPSRMGHLFQLVAGLSLLSGDELRALRVKLGQELRRVIADIKLREDREVSIELKDAGGYRATIAVHHSKITGRAELHGATLTNTETGEVTEIPGELFRATTYEFLVNV
jgi:DNA invertase Pin-like site-specific DNA recombinase